MLVNSSAAAYAPNALPHVPEVADIVVGYLEQIGVEYVFGVPGGAIEPLYNALSRSMRRGSVRPVVARHESGAAFMADGYARETGKLGVCCATSGPGATNMLTGVACAYDNNIPLLVITGQPALPSFGKRALQESSCTGINTLSIFEACTRYNTLISHPGQLESKLMDAIFHAMQSPRGPAHISFPVDILRSHSIQTHARFDLRKMVEGSHLIDMKSIQSLYKEIRGAQRVVILIGRECIDATSEIFALANLLQAQVIVSPDAKGYINPWHSAYRGVFGFGGHKNAVTILHEQPDVILAFGTNFNELTSSGWSDDLLNERLIHVDVNQENLCHSPMARLHVHGHIKTVCEHVLKMLQTIQRDLIDTGVETATPTPQPIPLPTPERFLHEPEKYIADSAPIKPQRLMRELSRRSPPNTRFVADAGNSAVWAVHYLTLRDRRLSVRNPVLYPNPSSERRNPYASWLRVTMDFAPMGWAIGAAIGIARAYPNGGPVVCITGDGSYLMNGQELSVAQAEHLPVIFIILNDSALGMVKHGQRLARAEQIAFEIPSIDYAQQAHSMGVQGHVIETASDFDTIDFAGILAQRIPCLLDIRIDPEECPPMHLRVQTLGSAHE